jgi:hypothetical protein
MGSQVIAWIASLMTLIMASCVLCWNDFLPLSPHGDWQWCHLANDDRQLRWLAFQIRFRLLDRWEKIHPQRFESRFVYNLAVYEEEACCNHWRDLKRAGQVPLQNEWKGRLLAGTLYSKQPPAAAVASQSALGAEPPPKGGEGGGLSRWWRGETLKGWSHSRIPSSPPVKQHWKNT